mgnify:CR=1 FL=1
MKSILFLDDWMIEYRDSLERVWGKAKFVKELFVNYYPNFLGYGGYITVFFDESIGKYVLYLAVFPPAADPEVFVVRLESDDLLNWPHPEYRESVVPAWKGFRNVVTDQNGHRFWPFSIIPLQGTSIEQFGYVTGEWYMPPAETAEIRARNGISALGFSQDGINFIVDREKPWRKPGSDVPGHIMWNESKSLFHIATRICNLDRRISIATSPDLKKFTDPFVVLQPDALDKVGTEFYEMPVRPYEDVFIGLLHVQTTDRFELNRYKRTGRMDTQLAYSYNGFSWYRPNRNPLIGLRDYGLLGGGQVYGQEMFRTPDNRLLFYSSSTMGEHAFYPDMQEAGEDTTGVIGTLLHELRLDGFCSLKTYAREGILRTKTLIPKGNELTINVITTNHTHVRVRILDGESAIPINGYDWDDAIPIRGDHLFAPVRWKEHPDISGLINKPVRIEIKIHEAEIFAIRLNYDAYFATLPLESLA